MQNSIPDPGRDHQFDNIRLILIFFVIFGHLIEYFAAGGILYRWIYSFHMPVFIFVSGYFAKFDPKKIVCNILVPYVLLQILYTAFDRLLYGNAPFRLQFTTPYWLLWYLLSLFCYYLLLPLILLHGFFVRLAGAYGLFAYHDWNYLLAFGCSVCMIAAFGNRPVSKLFTFIFTAKWADKIYAYCKGRGCEKSLP